MSTGDGRSPNERSSKLADRSPATNSSDGTRLAHRDGEVAVRAATGAEWNVHIDVARWHEERYLAVRVQSRADDAALPSAASPRGPPARAPSRLPASEWWAARRARGAGRAAWRRPRALSRWRARRRPARASHPAVARPDPRDPAAGSASLGARIGCAPSWMSRFVRTLCGESTGPGTAPTSRPRSVAWSAVIECSASLSRFDDDRQPRERRNDAVASRERAGLGPRSAGNSDSTTPRSAIVRWRARCATGYAMSTPVPNTAAVAPPRASAARCAAPSMPRAMPLTMQHARGGERAGERLRHSIAVRRRATRADDRDRSGAPAARDRRRRTETAADRQVEQWPRVVGVLEEQQSRAACVAAVDDHTSFVTESLAITCCRGGQERAAPPTPCASMRSRYWAWADARHECQRQRIDPRSRASRKLRASLTTLGRLAHAEELSPPAGE